MQTKQSLGPWYEAKTGNHQGVIVDEKTGANIAVAYDKVNASLIAASPDLLHMLYTVLPIVEDAQEDPTYKSGHIAKVVRDILTTIREAEGR